MLPCIETYTKVDLRTITLDVPPQEVVFPPNLLFVFLMVKYQDRINPLLLLLLTITFCYFLYSQCLLFSFSFVVVFMFGFSKREKGYCCEEEAKDVQNCFLKSNTCRLIIIPDRHCQCMLPLATPLFLLILNQ